MVVDKYSTKQSQLLTRTESDPEENKNKSNDQETEKGNKQLHNINFINDINVFLI
jgi:hypothetical protein